MTRRRFLHITAVAGASAALGAGLLRGLLGEASLSEVRETRTQMGTLVTITVVHSDEARARQMAGSAFGEIERLESILSGHRQGTPISRLNGQGVLQDAPAEALAVVRRALDYSALTGGAFDITVKPLLDLYSSSFAQTGAPPSDAGVREALSKVGYRNVRAEGRTIELLKPGMSVTLDGIAKGYIVDRAVGVLRQQGAGQVLVEAGGDIGSSGGGPRGDWTVAVQNPRSAGSPLGLLRIRGDAVSTSGDYFNSFTEDRRFNHLFDPATGRSPEETSAVTVVAATAMDADALSTGVFVMGPRKGLELLNRTEGVEGLIVTKGLDVLRSNGLSRYAI